MASKIVEETVIAHLRAAFPDVAIYTENVEGELPEDGSGFMMVAFPVATDERLPLGTRYYRERGGFRVMIVVERQTGMDLIRERGEAVAAIFRDADLPNGIHCQAPSPPRSDPENDQASRWVAFVTVPFWRGWRD